MQKRLLLEQIASEGYNVGYTARMHFATFDIATKAPGWMTLLSLTVATLSLFVPCLGSKPPTAALLIVGISMLYVRHYEERLADYEAVANFLNEKFKRLHDLSNAAEATQDSDSQRLDAIHASLVEVRNAVKNKSIGRQIFGASWRAHYQFFWVIESAWVAKHRQPPFEFFFDKMPVSFYLTLITVGLLLVAGFAVWAPAALSACGLGVVQ